MSASSAARDSNAEWPDWKYVESALSLYKKLPNAHWDQPHGALVRELLRVRENARKMDSLLDGWYLKPDDENKWRWNSMVREIDDILYPKVPREEVQKLAGTVPPPLAGEGGRS